MTDASASFLQILLSALGVGAGLESGSLAIFAAVLAAAVLVALVHAVVVPRSGRAPLGRPRRAIDVSAPLLQSDPDADGHSRSRAPGCAASAA